MALRCRKDDIAIVLSGKYSGYFVTVGEFMGTVNVRCGDGKVRLLRDCWEVISENIPLVPGTTKTVFSDASLLPIPPGDLDESEENEKTLEFVERKAPLSHGEKTKKGGFKWK